MSYDKEQPYNELPNLFPENNLWETLEVYKKLADARASLAELKGRLPVIPNPMMLMNTLVLQEAKDSSTIENIFTTNDELYKAFSSSNTSLNLSTKEVLRYREALWNAFSKMKSDNDYSQELAVDIFKTITGKNEEIRTVQVFIGSSTNVVYTPPEPGNILKDKLNNWFESALNNHTIDPLIKMALLHYQFEAIHPFTDGNGRTGRILNVLFLCNQKLLQLILVDIRSTICAAC